MLVTDHLLVNISVQKISYIWLKEKSLANWIPSFLGIPRNSQKFPTMQMSSDLKSLELLGIFGKGRLQFNEDLEFFGIPRNSQLYKLPTLKKGGILGKFWEFKIWDSLNALSSHKFQEILNTLNVKVLRKGVI